MHNSQISDLSPVDRTAKTWQNIGHSSNKASHCELAWHLATPYKYNDYCTSEKQLSTHQNQWLSKLYCQTWQLFRTIVLTGFCLGCILIAPLCLISIAVQAVFERGR